MLKSLRSLSIRTRLMCIVLILLVIPWMGYQYVQEMKQFLVQGQKNALLLTANGIATLLNNRSELFNPETGVPEVLGEENGLYAHRLDNLIQLDGQSTDWESVQEHAHYYTGNELSVCDREYEPQSFSVRNIVGYHEQYLYVLFEINDDSLVYRDLELLSLNNSDQLRMLIQPPEDGLEHYLLVASGPGRMSTFLVDEQWELPLQGSDVTTFTAELATTEWGYRIELRIPRDLIGYRSRIGFFAVDVDDPDNRELDRIIPISPQVSGKQPSQILITSPELTRILQGLDQPQSRIWIMDNLQRVRAVVGELPPLSSQTTPREEEISANTLYGHIQTLINNLFSRPPARFSDYSSETTFRPDRIFTTVLNGAPRAELRLSLDGKAEIVAAGYPIRSGNEILGAVVVEQSIHAILALQYQLLRNLTLITLGVFILVLATLFIFAWRLTVRVRRLHDTTEQAITPEGRVLEDRIPSRLYPEDELGDLGRSITSMLHRLSGYTRYLEGMPDTLAHEMNNPLNVVSSSLQILETDIPRIRHNTYMQRALNGIHRLRLILTNLTEAANLEEAMHNETKKTINLVSLLSDYMGGYRASHPGREFILDIPSSSIMVNGSPDYLAQMLDKLIDNAIQFSERYKPVVVRIAQNDKNAEISVLNEGRELPEHISSTRLFDPMVSFGKHNAQHSNLGLGLFVVRLIVEYHQGKVWAENRTDARGVQVTVWIPLSASGRSSAIQS